MEKIANKIWRAWLGFDPCLEQKKLFIEQSLKDKVSLEEICGRYQMPELFYIGRNDPSEPVEFQGEKITIAEIEKRFPFKRIIILKARQ
jgi:hypothetical protein